MLPTLTVLEPPHLEPIAIAIVRQAEEKPTHQTYKVKKGDTLISIAKRFKTSWNRLYDKNTNISNPDLIEPGSTLKIPQDSEKLKARKVPSGAIIQLPVRTATSRNNSPRSGGYLLLGSIGSVKAYGNCVNEPGVNNPGSGNPITWPVLFYEPRIGATALWTYNHTGVVTGIWSNGDIEVRHQNFSGMRTRFARSEFRGFR